MRRAASMVELVIAIVVMGIAVMSLPMILTQSQNSNAMALQQEVILATKTKLGYLLSYEWDVNSYDPTASVSRVLNTTASANADNDFDTLTTRRIGHVVADTRRKLRDNNASPTPDDGNAAWGSSALEDIDDFDGKDENTTIASETMDYIFNLQLRPTINYVSDSATYTNQDITFTFDANTTFTNPTNIKMITVQSRDTSNNVNIILRAFASNVGESTIMKRAW